MLFLTSGSLLYLNDDASALARSLRLMLVSKLGSLSCVEVDSLNWLAHRP
jgi:hypothetical protein